MVTCVQGKHISADKAIEYNGDWKGIVRHGQGVMHDSQRGLQYKGSWKDDLMEVERRPGRRSYKP